MARTLFAALALLALSAGCGGGDDNCLKCTASNYQSICPTLTKQCPGFTQQVQTCSGPAGGQACCVTDVAQVNCN
jgi:hypothetical protein